MAQNIGVSTAPNKNGGKYTAAELRKLERSERRKELYEKAKAALQAQDITKTQTRSYTIYNKENLRTYMQNPAANEGNLRNLSRFLYRVSQPYRRLINYNAQQIDLSAMTISPNIDTTQEVNKETVLKDYYATCVQVDKMNLCSEMYKMLVTAWVEDAAFGYVYEDDTGFFIWMLDGDYCKVSSINSDGSMNYAFNFSYFRNRQSLLEYWAPEFQEKYELYKKDNSLKWQELDSERTICLKVGIDDPTLSLPPYSALWENLIDQIDLLSLATVKNELSIYKMLVARLNHMSGSEDPDDFEVDVDFALEYFNKMIDVLPPAVTATISPLPIDTIEFQKTSTEDTDMVAKSMSNLFKISGASMVLNDEHTGASIYRAQILADMMNALRPLLGEIEVWVNRYLSYTLSNPGRVKFLEVSHWLKSEKKKELLESAQYGIPVKMGVAALDGYSPLEIMRMQALEADILQLQDNWIPLKSSFTQSGKDSGGQTKDIDTLGDEGDKSREAEKNKM